MNNSMPSLDFCADLLRRSGYTVVPSSLHSQTFPVTQGPSQTFHATPGHSRPPAPTQPFTPFHSTPAEHTQYRFPPPPLDTHNPVHAFAPPNSLQTSLPNRAPLHKIPKLPEFTGTPGDDFDLFKYEVNCLIRGQQYSELTLLEAIRRSLRGKARTVLLHLGENASLPDILRELEGIYGNVSSPEKKKEQFYSAVQEERETVADYSLRLEHLIRHCGQLPADSKDEMLRNRLWSGLRDSMLRNMSRYKYESINDFNMLRKELRRMEQEMGACEKSGRCEKVDSVSESRSEEVSSNMTVVESRLLKQVQEMTDEFKKLGNRVERLEKEMKNVKESGKGEDGQKRWYNRRDNRNEERALNKSRPPTKGQ